MYMFLNLSLYHTVYIVKSTFYMTFCSAAEDKFDFKESRSKWDEDWDKSKGPFPFSEKLGEISDKIGSTIDDTINMFRKKDRDDSPDRFRSAPSGLFIFAFQITSYKSEQCFFFFLQI